MLALFSFIKPNSPSVPSCVYIHVCGRGCWNYPSPQFTLMSGPVEFLPDALRGPVRDLPKSFGSGVFVVAAKQATVSQDHVPSWLAAAAAAVLLLYDLTAPYERSQEPYEL